MPGPAACWAQAPDPVIDDHYPPFFTVDITDLADPFDEADLYETSRGEAMDVNNDGFAVGWFTEKTSGDDFPFFMSPVDGGSAEQLPLDSAYTSGHAIGMSETIGYDLTNAIIVGWARRLFPSVSLPRPEAVYWTWNGTTWDFQVVPFPIARIGEAQAVTDSGQIAGFYLDPDFLNEERIFTYDPFGDVLDLPSNLQAVAFAARDDGTNTPVISGMFMSQNESNGFYLKDLPGKNLHGVLTGQYPGFSGSRALGMSRSADGTRDDIVGFGTGLSVGSDAVFWWRNGSTWKVALLNLPKPDPIDAMGTAINDRDDNLWIDLTGDYQPSNGDRGAFYVTMRENGSGGIDYWSYRLDETTSGLEPHPALTMFPLAVRNDPLLTPRTWTGNGINNTSAIAGSYKPDSSFTGDNDYLPCLFVPNDFDNDGVPDIREILHGTGLDTNNNWILDTVEEMRIGLFGPGGSTSQAVPNVQVARLMGYHQGTLNKIVLGQNPECTNAVDAFNDWGVDAKDEIILNARSRNPNHDDPPGFNLKYEYDILLDSDGNAGGITSAQNLSDIRTFAFRFARNIDGLQFGNEIFTGPGRYFFYTGDLPFSGFTGDIKLADTPKKLIDAMDAIFDQLAPQGEAARIGSALAGRPLRIFGPSVSAGMTKVGYCGTPGLRNDPNNFTLQSDRGATAIAALVEFTNKHFLIFDQHLNYHSIAELEKAVDRLTNEVGAGGTDCPGLLVAPWGAGPNFFATLEIGPMPEKTWWDTGGEDGALVHFGAKNTCTPGGDAWWVYVKRWRDFPSPIGFDGDFQLGDVYPFVEGAAFRYLCVNIWQQGATFDNDGNAIALSRPEMGMLRANKVDPSCLVPPGNFMPIADDYVIAAAEFQITGFTPHPAICTVVCQ